MEETKDVVLREETESLVSLSELGIHDYCHVEGRCEVLVSCLGELSQRVQHITAEIVPQRPVTTNG